MLKCADINPGSMTCLQRKLEWLEDPRGGIALFEVLQAFYSYP